VDDAMTGSGSKLKKVGLIALAGLLLTSAFYSQNSLNKRREALGLTRLEVPKNAPPLVAFTTVVLGGFRGLIANALWVRAMELQDEDKYFEKVQLADWITKLTPHNTTVWIVQAWDMSYNISIKFSDPADRWRWVYRGIQLLRDEALKYNPREVPIYRELAWHFQNKMGHNLDDMHLYYKSIWAGWMQEVLGGGHPNFDELIDPKTPEAAARARRLREEFKMDPAIMKEVDQQYGPLEWRLPESHAIYWAVVGKRNARKKEELIQLRRVIYQSMDLAFKRGRLIENKGGEGFRFGENIDLVEKTNAAYEEAMAEDQEMRDHIARAHKNFLLNAVNYLYVHSRPRDAERWFKIVKEKYPKDYPENMTLDEYVLSRFGEDLGETDMNRTISNIYGALEQSYLNLIDGETDTYNGYQALARTIWARYQSKIVGGPSEKRVGLRPLSEMRDDVLRRLLDPQTGLRPEAAAILRSQLGDQIPAPLTNAPPASSASPASTAPGTGQ